MTTVLPSGRLSTREEETAAHPAPLVLLVEDHEDTRVVFRYMLEMRGYRVAEAVDGEGAVRLASKISPDLILMDGSLPRLDGLAATRLIRQLPSRGGVPIVFLSGHAEAAFCAAAREAGCDDYLTKPLDVNQLERVLARYAARGGSVEV